MFHANQSDNVTKGCNDMKCSALGYDQMKLSQLKEYFRLYSAAHHLLLGNIELYNPLQREAALPKQRLPHQN